MITISRQYQANVKISILTFVGRLISVFYCLQEKLYNSPLLAVIALMGLLTSAAH